MAASADSQEANLSRNIFLLRKALGEGLQDKYIVTVPGRGYRFAEDLECRAAARDAGNDRVAPR